MGEGSIVKKAISLALLGTIAVLAMALAGASSAAGPNEARAVTPNSGRGELNLAGAAVVKQIGARNYAGPNCPGVSWNCTTATRVLQVSTAGGTNVGVCTDHPAPSGANQTCEITQSGSKNTARCTEQSSDVTATLSCSIDQTGAENYAFVAQTTNQSDGSTQTGQETATVKQRPAASIPFVTNQLQLSQTVNQSVKIGSVQVQNAFQTATVEQTASGTGYNLSQVNQSQAQKAYAKSTTQSQNTSGGTDCTTDEFQPGPSQPNVCAEISQESVGGKNENHLRQSIADDMNSTGPATQTQGLEDEGGLKGHVHQKTESARSVNEVNQSKTLKETAPKGSTLPQKQFDPISCCGFASQEGGSGNSETINQSSALSATGPNPTQKSSLIGTSRTPVGTCTITQSASTNGSSATSSDTETPECPFLTLTTSCTPICAGPPDGEGDTNPPPGFFGEPDSNLTKGVRNPAGCIEGPCPYGPAATVNNGGTVEYQITYSNDGNAAATGVTVTDTLDPHLAYASCSGGTSCSYNADSRTITWDLGTVSAFNEFPEQLFFSAAAGANCGPATVFVPNTASATTEEEESPTESNSADVTITVGPC
jgi:uncharacterized repeat protein (TIGR01451 family)